MKALNIGRKLLASLLALTKSTPLEVIIIERFGTFSTDLVAANQCKDQGWKDYEYLIKITCHNKLDSNGFLIDNRAINKVMKESLKQMLSCEMLCCFFADQLEALFKKHGVPVCEMRVSIKPSVPGVVLKDWAEFDFHRIYQKTAL